MRLPNSYRSLACLTGAGLLLSMAPLSAPAQALGVAQAQPADELEQQTSWLKDFIHFVKVARFDIAADVGSQLLESGIDPEAFVDLVDGSREQARFEEAIAAAMRVPVIEPVAARLDVMYRSGKLASVRNADEITRNIGLLSGGLRARQLGRERLIAAGEYALPQLMDAFLQNRDPNLRAQVQRVLVDLGRQSIMPLVSALPDLDPARQEAIVDVLGLIPYRTSVPFIVDLFQNTDVQAVRQACTRSLGRLDADPNRGVASLYRDLANAYYNEPGELTSFAGEDFQLLWSFDPGLGLVMSPVRTPVFHEAMSMRMGERSLLLDPTDREMLALWVAANYSRELDSPADYENPAYPSDRRGAAYFGVAAGPDIDQLILRRALDDRDTPLARLAIDALAQTAGPNSLWGEPQDGRFPLLEALTYPNRRVQYESAIALGRATPQETFRGAERVVPLLASAVRDATALHAVVLTGSDRESYQVFRSELESMGFTVLPPAESGLDAIEAAIAEIPAVDLIVTSVGFDQTLLEIETARNDDKLSATPVLALMSAEDLAPLSRQYQRDQTVAVRRSSISNSEFANSADALLLAASGGVITQDEAEDYAGRAVLVLRDLAVSGNRVLDVSEGSAILIDVLGVAEGLAMIDVAEVLSYVDSPAAQSAIFEKSLDAESFDQIELLAIVADSGKRYGNKLDARQTRRLIELAQAGDESLATQAVATMGALEIENSELVPLILGGDPRQTAGTR